ncbi:MAG TPA: YdcF family protein [Bauldia sp.]|nr:YdcF family protein [Bauldia sp.]
MSDGRDDDPALATAPGTKVRATRRRPIRLVLALAGAAVVGLGVGFLAFADMVAKAVPPADPRAEGIVVLTGGTARINGALALLAEGRAERLLISGVNPAVGREAIAEMVPSELRPTLDCCVDLDHARDTIENASSTGEWTSRQGFSSLIVVTSDYHMPRSMAELRDAMPAVRLIAFPVATPDLDLRRWWRDPEAFSLLLREYGKYLAAETRLLLPSSRTAIAAGS